MKRTVLFFLCLISVCAWSQNTGEGWSYKFSGIIDPQMFYDTREIVSSREEHLLFYPAPRVLDADGNDINAQPSLNMLSTTARLCVGVTAPNVGKTKVAGYFEGDFTGSTNDGINMFRIRHAYVQLGWEKSNLLLGQTWHPMVADEVMPGTRPLNMGVPFHPYSRFVQTRYTYTADRYKFMATASFELDNKMPGSNGASTAYLRNSCLPELNARICRYGDRLLLGVMYNYVLLQPRTETALGLKTDTHFGSGSVSLYGKYDFEEYSLRIQTVYGENLYDQLMIGGYIETPNFEGYYDYTPWGSATAWFDFGRSKGFCRPGIFCGYGKNLDFGQTIDAKSHVYGRGFDIEYLWRVQPRVGFYPSNYLNFALEVEYTEAAYGDKNTVADGSYSYTSGYNVGNLRFIGAVIFRF